MLSSLSKNSRNVCPTGDGERRGFGSEAAYMFRAIEERIFWFEKKCLLTWRGRGAGSVGKDACCQARCSDFEPNNSCNGRREPTPLNCSPASTSTPWYTCEHTCLSTYTHIQIDKQFLTRICLFGKGNPWFENLISHGWTEPHKISSTSGNAREEAKPFC